MRLSRSGPFSLAPREYLPLRGQQEVVEQLNRVYSGKPDSAARQTAARMKAKFHRTLRNASDGDPPG
jgi:hypothetical protein